MDQTLIESVVKQVVSQMNQGSTPRAGAGIGSSQPAVVRSGRFGVFQDVNEAVVAAQASHEQLVEQGVEVRRAICKMLKEIPAGLNETADGNAESRIEAPDSGVQVWVLPTNEELIVARQTVDVLANQ